MKQCAWRKLTTDNWPLTTALKHLLNKWSLLILSVLKPLGIWGVLGFAAVDAAFLGMPLDAIVAGYSYADPKRFLLYSAMGATGSALGSIVIYLIGYKGGEMLLVKRIGQQRFDKITASFERHEFLAIMLPSMLPPPTPFKLFVLSAGVAEMSFTRFLGAIFFGRLLRFSHGFADRHPLRPADPGLCRRHGAQSSAPGHRDHCGRNSDWLVDGAPAQAAQEFAPGCKRLAGLAGNFRARRSDNQVPAPPFGDIHRAVRFFQQLLRRAIQRRHRSGRALAHG